LPKKQEWLLLIYLFSPYLERWVPIALSPIVPDVLRKNSLSGGCERKAFLYIKKSVGMPDIKKM
jgi:hypothetical protein